MTRRWLNHHMHQDVALLGYISITALEITAIIYIEISRRHKRAVVWWIGVFL